MGFSLLDLHDAYEMARDASETDEQRAERERHERKTFLPRLIVAGVLAGIFLIGMFSMVSSMDAERAKPKAEAAPAAVDPQPAVDCDKNPWGLGCP